MAHRAYLAATLIFAMLGGCTEKPPPTKLEAAPVRPGEIVRRPCGVAGPGEFELRPDGQLVVKDDCKKAE